jgi:hypothetical protein
VVPLSRGLELLESAVSYALAVAPLGTPQLLRRPTPCPGWDLETLLDHVSDSIGVLHEAITAEGAGASAAPPGYRGPGPDPVARLRGQAVRLLGAWAAAGPAERRVAIWDRECPRTGTRFRLARGDSRPSGWSISVGRQNKRRGTRKNTA